MRTLLLMLPNPQPPKACESRRSSGPARTSTLHPTQYRIPRKRIAGVFVEERIEVVVPWRSAATSQQLHIPAVAGYFDGMGTMHKDGDADSMYPNFDQIEECAETAKGVVA